MLAKIAVLALLLSLLQLALCAEDYYKVRHLGYCTGKTSG